MMKTTLLWFCCIVLGATAYQFDDALYNQFLANDFESLANEVTALSHRSRRDTQDQKCDKHNYLCCGAEEVKAMHNALRTVRTECFKEVTGYETFHGKPFDPFNCEDIENRKKELICIKECVGKKKDFIHSDGNLKEDVVKKFIVNNIQMEWLKPEIDGFLTKCFAEAKEAAENMDKSDKDACNPAHLRFSYCLYREVQLGCPADQIADQKTCEIIRQFAKNSFFFAPHPPFH